MSEQQPRSNPRLDNFEANKQANEQVAFEDSLYGAEAGVTDFSDTSYERVKEADAYERHLESMAERPAVADETAHYDAIAEQHEENEYMARLQTEAIELNQSHDDDLESDAATEAARIDDLMESDVRVRQMRMIAEDIAGIGATAVTPDTEVRLSQALKDKQERLEALLMAFSEASNLSPDDTQRIMDRIIDLSSREPVEATLVDEEPEYQEDQPEAVEPESTEDEHVEPTEAEAVEPEPEQESEEEPDEPEPKTSEAPVSEDEPEAEPEEAPSKTEEETTIEQSRFDVDAAFAKLQSDVAEHGESRQAETDAARNGTEQAKADRALLEEGPESSSGSEAPTVASETEPAEEAVESTEDEKPRSKKERVKDFLTPAGIAAGVGAWWASRAAKKREAEPSHDDDVPKSETEDSKESSRKKKILVGLGAVAVVAGGTAVYLLNRNNGGPTVTSGSGLFPTDLFTGFADSVDKAGTPSKSGGEIIGSLNREAAMVNPNDGLNDVFKRMDIPREQWQAMQESVGAKLERINEAYRSNGEYRLSNTGELSSKAQAILADAKSSLGRK